MEQFGASPLMPEPALINSINKSASKTLTASQMKSLRDELQHFDEKVEPTGTTFKIPKLSMFSLCTGEKLPSPTRPPLGCTFAAEETKTTDQKRFQPKREDEFLAELEQIANPNVRRTLFSKKPTPKSHQFPARRTSIRKSASVKSHNINVSKNKKTPVKFADKSRIGKSLLQKPSVVAPKIKPESNEHFRAIIHENTECIKTIENRVNSLENDHSSQTDTNFKKYLSEYNDLSGEEKSVYSIVKENNDLLKTLLNRVNSLENTIKQNKCTNDKMCSQSVDSCSKLNTDDKMPEIIVQKSIKHTFTFEQLELNVENMSLSSINIEDSPGNCTVLEKTPYKSKTVPNQYNNNMPDYIQRYNEMRTDFPLLCTPKLDTNQKLMTPSVKSSTKKLLSRKVQEQLFLLNRQF